MARVWERSEEQRSLQRNERSDGTLMFFRLLTNWYGWDLHVKSVNDSFQRFGIYDEWPSTYMELLTWLDPHEQVILASHGCFRKDKATFDHLIRYYGLPFPSKVTFFDTLLWTREHRRRHSYSLKSLYKDQFGQAPKNLEYAMGHVEATHRLFANERLCGYVYPALLTPLQTVKGIGGLNERLFVSANLLCVEDLAHCMRERALDVQQFESLLACKMHIKPADAHTIAHSVRDYALLFF